MTLELLKALVVVGAASFLFAAGVWFISEGLWGLAFEASRAIRRWRRGQ